MQEDIAGIGQRQGRHGKYATFYVERKMSEDFRDTPLVRTTVSRNASGVLHYIFASGKNIVASVNARPCKKQPGNSVTGRNKGSPICLPKEKSLFRWPCDEPRMKQRFQPTLAWWKPQELKRTDICRKKTASPFEEDVPEDKTDE